MRKMSANNEGFLQPVSGEWNFSEEPLELWDFLENLFLNVPEKPNRFYKKKLKYYSEKFKKYRDSI